MLPPCGQVWTEDGWAFVDQDGSPRLNTGFFYPGLPAHRKYRNDRNVVFPLKFVDFYSFWTFLMPLLSRVCLASQCWLFWNSKFPKFSDDHMPIGTDRQMTCFRIMFLALNFFTPLPARDFKRVCYTLVVWSTNAACSSRNNLKQ